METKEIKIQDINFDMASTITISFLPSLKYEQSLYRNSLGDWEISRNGYQTKSAKLFPKYLKDKLKRDKAIIVEVDYQTPYWVNRTEEFHHHNTQSTSS